MERPKFLTSEPQIHESCFIAPSADVMGAVEIGEDASVWYQTVLRADINRIVIGAGSNVQDGCVVHLADDYEAYIGNYVTVGHRALVHACTVHDEVLIGMGAIVMDGCEIGERSIIGAGALLTMHQKIPPGSLVLGSPAKVIRTLALDEQQKIRKMAEKYVHVSRYHQEQLAKQVDH